MIRSLKKINKTLKIGKLNRGKKKITAVVYYMKEEANIYCLLLFPEQAEVALSSSKVQLSVVTSRKHF